MYTTVNFWPEILQIQFDLMVRVKYETIQMKSLKHFKNNLQKFPCEIEWLWKNS